MIFLRGFAFILSLLLAAGMVVWQVDHLREVIASASSPGILAAMMGLGVVILAVQAAVARYMDDEPGWILLAFAGLLVLPLTALVGGVLSLIQLKSGNHRRIWTSVLSMGALLGMNVALPMLVGALLISGGGGLMAGWTAVKLQFFIVVDYFLARSIVYYFNSGASAFVSLRYLRRRVLSLLAVFGIGLGVVVLIVVNSVMTGFQTDFRDQMRGSLSHVLVRIQGESVRMRLDDMAMARAEWAEYVRRIEAERGMAQDWHEALDRALLNWREADKDGLPDPADFLDAQPPTPGNGDEDDPGQTDRPGLSDDEAALLERLRTGDGLTVFEMDCLTDEDGRSITPTEFYLDRVGNPEEAEEEIKPSWFGPVFRAGLQDQFDRAETALMEHENPQGEPDVEGVSWRVNTKTFITPKSGSRELPIAELVGVDPERETNISNVGEYVARAEFTEFRQQFVLQPMLNILGANLGWETEQSVTAADTRPLFAFTETGFLSRGRRLPDDATNYLAIRRFLSGTGRVRWSSFDAVEYHEFSPGQRIYERVRDAYKDASRSEDIDELGRMLEECRRDIRAILLEYIEDYPTDERFQKVNHNGAKIIFFEYLTGYGETVKTIRLHHNESDLRLKHGEEAGGEGSDDISALRAALGTLASEYTNRVQDLHMPEGEREELLLAYGRKHRELLRATAEASDGDLRQLIEELLATTRRPEELLRLRTMLEMRRAVPLGYAAASYDEMARHVRSAMAAYRKVLPVRTSMTPGEDPADYLKRARRPLDDDALPGIILGDVLAESALGREVNIGDQIAVTIPRIYYRDGRTIPDTTEVWFKVTGLFRSGLYEENASRMYCDFEVLTEILADSEISYTVGARVADYGAYEGQANSDRLKADVRAALDEHNVRFSSVGVWEDETRTLLEAVNIERALIELIVSLIVMLAGGAIVIIVYQLVNEKVKDIGILKALGQSPWGIRSVFMFNALFIGLFGALGGAVLGIVVSEYLSEIEDFIDQWTGYRLFPPDIYFLTHIPSVQGWELIWLTVDIAVPVVMFGFFCGILPSMAAARKDPIEALHYE